MRMILRGGSDLARFLGPRGLSRGAGLSSSPFVNYW